MRVDLTGEWFEVMSNAVLFPYNNEQSIDSKNPHGIDVNLSCFKITNAVEHKNIWIGVRLMCIDASYPNGMERTS